MSTLIVGVLLAVFAIVPSRWAADAQTAASVTLQTSRAQQIDAPPHSQAAQWQGRSINAEIGAYEGYRNFGVGWTPAALWRHVGRSSEELVPEFYLGFSDYNGHVFERRNRLWHVGAAAFFRWYCAPRSYVEAGMGPTLFTHDTIGNHILSTHLQFGDSIGFAHRFTGTLTLGLRISHFSNAGFKRPNDGVSFVQLVASHSF